MLDFIRNHQRIIQIVLGVLVLPSFLFFGVSDYQSFTSRDVELAKVGKTNISQETFRRTWQEQLNTLQAQQGANFDIAKQDTPANRRAWLNQLVAQAVETQELVEGRFNATDNMVRNVILADATFQKDGQFDKSAYMNFLQSNNITDIQYNQFVRQRLALNQITTPIASSYLMPKETEAAMFTALTQERDVELKMFKAADYLSQVSTTAEEEQKWYEANKQSFEVPQHVDAQYVVLNEEVANKGVSQISDADLQQYYEANQARFTIKERRLISHIQINIPAGNDGDATALKKAQDLVAKAKANPSGFAQLAEANSDDAGTKAQGGVLGWISAGDQFPLETATFAMKDKGISDPIKVDNAYHIIDLTNIQAGSVKPFADVKEQLKNEIVAQKAGDVFQKLSESLSQGVDTDRNSLQAAADSISAKVKIMKDVAATGLMDPNAEKDNPDANYFKSNSVLKSLFSDEVLKQGLNSTVIPISPAELIVLRVGKNYPAHIPAFDEVKAEVQQRLRQEKASALAVQAGGVALKDQQAGSGKLSFDNRIIKVNHLAQPFSTDVVNMIMSAPKDKLPAYVGFDLPNKQGYAVARISKVGEVNPETAKLIQTFMDRFVKNSTQIQMLQATNIELQKLHKVEYLPEADKTINENDPRDGSN